MKSLFTLSSWVGERSPTQLTFAAVRTKASLFLNSGIIFSSSILFFSEQKLYKAAKQTTGKQVNSRELRQQSKYSKWTTRSRALFSRAGGGVPLCPRALSSGSTACPGVA